MIMSQSIRIIDFESSIPGFQGDYIYVSSTGEFTTSDTSKIAFLKLQDAIPTVLIGKYRWTQLFQMGIQLL